MSAERRLSASALFGKHPAFGDFVAAGDLPGESTGRVMDWLAQTYNLSVAGTTAANSADSWGRDAFSMAVDGTNAAAAAQATATTALNLAKFVDKGVQVKLTGGRQG